MKPILSSMSVTVGSLVYISFMKKVQTFKKVVFQKLVVATIKEKNMKNVRIAKRRTMISAFEMRG